MSHDERIMNHDERMQRCQRDAKEAEENLLARAYEYAAAVAANFEGTEIAKEKLLKAAREFVRTEV